MKTTGTAGRRSRWIPLLFFWLAAAGAAGTPDNPKPAEGDLVLPMPGGREMVFRPVTVPGSAFWGDRRRVVQLGDAAGGMFEGLQRLQVSGSFPEGDHWVYYLGKYEVTLGQYIAVMGLDRLRRVSADPRLAQLDRLDEKARKKLLRTPVTYLPYPEILAFIDAWNRWLFDPEHPERREALPAVEGVPGFVRLPTEVEWEYAARGGEPARQQGIFDRPLPYPEGKINRHAWHLGNARHKVRPVGLRRPNPLGLHDMHGNVQEVVDGRFLPEIWQGTPGGVPVRGGSVSTPAGELRSSLRSELDDWSWDPDRRRMVRRASFNTGFRLAIGTNVVTSPARRAELEAGYADYLAGLRASTPVGQTLDNLVARAGSTITGVDPIMERLAREHPELAHDLAAIRHYLDKARKELDEAQRATARSLMQDALRNGVNFSVFQARAARLREALETARRLLALSTRYRDQVEEVERRLAEMEQAADAQFRAYLTKVEALGDYAPDFLEEARAVLEAQNPGERERRVLALLLEQTEASRRLRRAEPEAWRAAFARAFEDFEPKGR